jgi:hypothetical protein
MNFKQFLKGGLGMQNWTHYIFAALFIGFIIYRRTKRTIGFQKLSRRRLMFRTIMFGVLGLVILGLGFLHPIFFVADAIGLVGGVALGLVAIRHTRFEKREDVWFYRTHLWVEITVLVLFLGRVAYRMLFIVSANSPNAMNPNDPSQLAKDPLTAGIFFVIVSFYLLYFVYLLKEEVKLDARSEPVPVMPVE